MAKNLQGFTEASNPEGGNNHEAIRENEIRIMMPDEENIRRLYEASKIGSIENLKTLIQEDPDILQKVLVSSNFNIIIESPLHVSVSRGHLEITEFLLDQKPDLAGEVDNLQRTPLHLACVNGEIEIVKALLEKNTSVCLVRDLKGMIPLHYAVIKGQIEIMKELIKARPQSAWIKLDNSQTVLHLCVKHNHLEALKLMTQISVKHDEEFLNTADDSGNTILDLSLMLRQVEMVKYLVNSIPGVKTGTSCIVTELPAPSSSSSSNPNHSSVVEETDQNAEITERSEETNEKRGKIWKKKLKYKGDWVQDVQGTMMLVATVIATMTFQGSINPPGGVWQQDTPIFNGNKNITLAWGRSYYYNAYYENNTIFAAGTAIMAYQLPHVFWFYAVTNAVSFVASVSVILLVISGFPLKNRICSWILKLAMCVAVLFLMVAYIQGIVMVSSNPYSFTPEAFFITYIAFMGMIHLVGMWYFIRSLVWIWKRLLIKFSSRLRPAYRRLFFSVYVFVCVCCVGVLCFIFYILVRFTVYKFYLNIL